MQGHAFVVSLRIGIGQARELIFVLMTAEPASIAQRPPSVYHDQALGLDALVALFGSTVEPLTRCGLYEDLSTPVSRRPARSLGFRSGEELQLGWDPLRVRTNAMFVCFLYIV
jgi:hypothetical protein